MTDVTSGVPSPGGPPIALWIPVVLAAVAGYVDAIGFLEIFGVFPANQSGNAILIGIAAGHFEWIAFWPPAVSILSFGVGVALAVRVALRVRAAIQVEVLLALEIVLLVAFAIWVPFTPTGTVPVHFPIGAGLMVLAASSMGVQTYAVHLTAGIQVVTTYQTGAIVQVAQALATPPERTQTNQHPLLKVLCFVFVAYLVGAALGAAAGELGRTSISVACVPLALILIARFISRRAIR